MTQFASCVRWQQLQSFHTQGRHTKMSSDWLGPNYWMDGTKSNNLCVVIDVKLVLHAKCELREVESIIASYVGGIDGILKTLHLSRSEELTKYDKTQDTTFASLLRADIVVCNISTLGEWICCRRNIAVPDNCISERCGS